MSFPLEKADEAARRLVEWLSPHCLRIEIAGSIRRRRSKVNDIDLVAIPRWQEEQDMFGNVVNRQNVAALALMARGQSEGWQLTMCGPSQLSFVAKGWPVDVWWCSEATWGTTLLCRTGSAQHNIWISGLARAAGGAWHPQLYLSLEHRKYAKTEEEIYAALGVRWLDPATHRDEPKFREVLVRTKHAL